MKSDDIKKMPSEIHAIMLEIISMKETLADILTALALLREDHKRVVELVEDIDAQIEREISLYPTSERSGEESGP